MEFTLDIDLIRQILRSEYDEAQSDIQAMGVIAAVAESGQRQDDRIAASADIGSLACRPGCAWCCHFTVDVRAAEVFSILDFVDRRLPDDEKARIYSQVQANSRFLESLDDDARVTQNLKCPFLKDSRCSIYSVRPQSCRNYHATDVAGCEQSYADPENLDIDPDFAPLVYQSGNSTVEAFSVAMRDAGFDTDAYELNAALDAALANCNGRADFLAGRKPFATLNGEGVMEQFDDLWD